MLFPGPRVFGLVHTTLSYGRRRVRLLVEAATYYGLSACVQHAKDPVVGKVCLRLTGRERERGDGRPFGALPCPSSTSSRGRGAPLGRCRAAVGHRRRRVNESFGIRVQRRGRPADSHARPDTHASDQSLLLCFRPRFPPPHINSAHLPNTAFSGSSKMNPRRRQTGPRNWSCAGRLWPPATRELTRTWRRHRPTRERPRGRPPRRWRL